MTCGMMTSEMNDLEIDWSLCSALMQFFVSSWVQSTNLTTNELCTYLILGTLYLLTSSLLRRLARMVLGRNRYKSFRPDIALAKTS